MPMNQLFLSHSLSQTVSQSVGQLFYIPIISECGGRLFDCYSQRALLLLTVISCVTLDDDKFIYFLHPESSLTTLKHPITGMEAFSNIPKWLWCSVMRTNYRKKKRWRNDKLPFVRPIQSNVAKVNVPSVDMLRSFGKCTIRVHFNLLLEQNDNYFRFTKIQYEIVENELGRGVYRVQSM